MNYRLKPFNVRAVQWKGDNIEEVAKISDKKLTMAIDTQSKLIIPTKYGNIYACLGEYVIQVADDRFVMSEEDFLKQYDPIELDSSASSKNFSNSEGAIAIIHKATIAGNDLGNHVATMQSGDSTLPPVSFDDNINNLFEYNISDVALAVSNLSDEEVAPRILQLRKYLGKHMCDYLFGRSPEYIADVLDRI